MKSLLSAFTVALGMAVAVAAQTSQTEHKSKTEVKIKDGKAVTVTGCVQRGADPSKFMLTDVAGLSGVGGSYELIAEKDEGEELARHVGHTVTIDGKAADQGDAKIVAKTKSETKQSGSEPKKTETKTEVKGDAAGLRFLSVKSVKMIAPECR